MAESDDVVTWQRRLEKVEQALAQLARPSAPADDPAKTPVQPEPEAVQPPKQDAKPPKEPTPEEPAPIPTRGLLHKAIFG